MWANIIRRVSIDPIHGPTWDEWVDKIKIFLRGGAYFKIEENIDIDGNYTMRTEYFHCMKKEENSRWWI